MVGLSVILENHKDLSAKPSPHQVISKGSCCSITKPLSPNGFSSLTKPLSSFLDNCFLCCQKLSPAKDIYMYKGDKAFCSEECRCRQIFMDEDEASRACCSTAAKGGCTQEYNCSCSMASATSAPSSSRPSGGGAGKRQGSRRNVFAY